MPDDSRQKLFFKGRLSASDKSLHTKDFVKAAQADKRTRSAALSRSRNRYSSTSSQQAGLQRRPPRPLEDIAVVEHVSFVMKGGTPR